MKPQPLTPMDRFNAYRNPIKTEDVPLNLPPKPRRVRDVFFWNRLEKAWRLKYRSTLISWQSMHIRCKYKSQSGYKHYGGRGIMVCTRWRSFARFIEDMGPRPEGLTLDRINVNGNYEPSNCRWATPLEQTHNRRPRAQILK